MSDTEAKNIARFERTVLFAKSGLTPPWWAEPLGFLHGEAWAEEAVKQAAHEQHVPPRRRRRMERAKRRSSRLDGRWHKRAKAQAEREDRFDREHDAREVTLDERAWEAWLVSPDFTDGWEDEP